MWAVVQPARTGGKTGRVSLFDEPKLLLYLSPSVSLIHYLRCKTFRIYLLSQEICD